MDKKVIIIIIRKKVCLPALLKTLSVTYTLLPTGSECVKFAVTLSVTWSRVGGRMSPCPGEVPARHSMSRRPDSGSWKLTQ